MAPKTAAELNAVNLDQEKWADTALGKKTNPSFSVTVIVLAKDRQDVRPQLAEIVANRPDRTRGIIGWVYEDWMKEDDDAQEVGEKVGEADA